MAKRKMEKEFKIRLAPYRDPVTMKLFTVDAAGCTVTVSGVDAYPKYGDNDGDIALFVVLGRDGTHVFSCPLERVMECTSLSSLIQKKSQLAVIRPLRKDNNRCAGKMVEEKR